MLSPVPDYQDSQPCLPCMPSPMGKSSGLEGTKPELASGSDRSREDGERVGQRLRWPLVTGRWVSQ